MISFAEGREPIPPRSARVNYADYDASVREVSHPFATEGGHVIVTEDGGQAIVPTFHYPMGRSCRCGTCTCYCKDCKEVRDLQSS